MASIATHKVPSSATRHLAVAAGAIIGMGVLTACSSGAVEKPASTATPPPPSSAEKAVNPGMNGSFTPSVKPRQGPTAVPGNIVTGG